jgi:hypothetical protein
MIASKISNNCARSAGDPGEEIFQGADPAFCGRSRQTIVSYDEKPGIQAIGTTAPDPAPEPGLHATFARDHEYKRNGTVSLLAGIDLLTAKVHALVRDRHRSREFIEPQASRRRLSGPHRDQVDPRQSHRAHPQANQKPGSPISPPAASNSPSLPSTACGSISSRASFPSSRDPSCATSL